MVIPLFNSFATISQCTSKRLNPISSFDSLKLPLHSQNQEVGFLCPYGFQIPWFRGRRVVPSHTGGGVIAVADGVSGWAEKDVDPALFSRQLMANASNLVEDEEVNYNTRNLIRKAHAAISTIGSATVAIAMSERNGTLKIANVGDCGVKVIRKDKDLGDSFPLFIGRVTFSTSPQEHYFDCPYQLSSEAVGQTFLDATVTIIELMEEDTVVMGFDNLFHQEII